MTEKNTATRPSADAHAAMLLTVQLHEDEAANPPLSDAQYAQLSAALEPIPATPGDLLGDRSEEIIDRLDAPDRTTARLSAGLLLAFRMQEWQSRSISTVTVHDPEYPNALKWLPATRRPAVIHVVGQLNNLRSDPEDRVHLDIHPQARRNQAAIDQVVSHIGISGHSVITEIDRSDANREAAIRLAQADTDVIATTAGDLCRHAVDRDFREHIIDGRMTLISTQAPNLPAPRRDLTAYLQAALGRRRITMHGSPPGRVTAGRYTNPYEDVPTLQTGRSATRSGPTADHHDGPEDTPSRARTAEGKCLHRLRQTRLQPVIVPCDFNDTEGHYGFREASYKCLDCDRAVCRGCAHDYSSEGAVIVG